MSGRLTPKQQRFIDEYLIDRNGRQAAIRAGYSPRCATEIAWETLRKPQVDAAIRDKSRALAQELGVSRRTAVQELLEAGEHAKMTGDAMSMIQAWHQIARLLDLYPSSALRGRAT